MSKTRIVYTTDFADVYGGGQAGLLLLLERLDRARFSPLLLAPAEGEMSRRARALGVDVRIFPLPPVRSAARAFAALRALRALLGTEGARVIHVDGPRAALYAALAKRGTAARVVWHVRTEERDGLLDRFLERSVDRIILVAEALRPRFSAAVRGKISVIYNGVELASAGAPSSALPDSPSPLVVCPARLDGEKGQDVLLEALAGQDASVWFAGRGETAVVERLKALAGGRAVFLGQRDDLRAVLARADVVVLPSLHEAFPRVLLEAMAEGRPVVATRVGGVPELVEDGVTGLLVPPRDAAALRDALVELLSDRERREKMGRAGRARAEKFSVESMVGRIEAVYDEESR